jgi:outer membrane protein assembly factor BamB
MIRAAGVASKLQATVLAALLLTYVACAACPSRQASDPAESTPSGESQHATLAPSTQESKVKSGSSKAGSAASAPWTFRANRRRQGQTSHTIPVDQPRILWRFSTGRPIYSSPALDSDGNVYIGSLDGHVYSVKPDGTQRWKVPLGGAVYGSPALVPGLGLVVGADNDQLVALNLETGAPTWSFKLGPCATGPGSGPDTVRCDADSSVVAGKDGTLYTGGDALYALRPSGQLRWRFDLGGHAFSSPAVHPVSGAIFVGSQGNTVQAVGPDGSGRWVFKSRGDCDATPALIDNDTLVVGCDDGYLYALGTSDGALKWQVAAQRRRPVRSSPAVDRAAGTVIFGADDGQITAVKLDGSVAWRHATGGPVRSSPVVDPQGRIVVGSQDDHVYALDRAGKLLWRVELGGDVDSSVAVGPKALYVGADDGNLYALTVKP